MSQLFFSRIVDTHACSLGPAQDRVRWSFLLLELWQGIIKYPDKALILPGFYSWMLSKKLKWPIVWPRSFLLCPFHKKLRIWWKRSFDFCQADNPRFSCIMYCYRYQHLKQITKYHDKTLILHEFLFMETIQEDEMSNWVISTSRTVLMNKNSGKIRSLSGYMKIPYQRHNNKNDHLSRPQEGLGLNAWVSRYHFPPPPKKKTLLLWKILSADNKGLPLCWLTKGIEFTYFLIFTSKLSISITKHVATKSWIIGLTKTEGLLPSNYQFLMKRTQQNTLRLDNK